ncbi:MAG: DUF4430 domain-containing protein [Candidatus Jacksonbacteria bacterium]
MNKIIKIICLITIFTITGCTTNTLSNNNKEDNATQLNINNSDEDNNENSNAVLQIDFGDDRIITNYELLNYENHYLWPVMKGVLEKNKVYLDFQDYGGDLGVFIKQIGDKKNGEDGKYWQYLVNGEYAKAGVSSYKVQAGDVILWKFTNQLFQ